MVGSFYLHPTLLGTLRPDHGKDTELIKAFFGIVEGSAGEARLAYLQGRVHQREGYHRKAQKKFEEAISLDATAPEPFERLAEALVSSGEPAAAEEVLRSALGSALKCTGELWDRWVVVLLKDMNRLPGEILARLAAQPQL